MNKNYEDILADLYYRLSDEDIAKGKAASVSESIANQKLIVHEFCERNNIKIHNEYYDDGISGTTFDRPGFQNMMVDIEKGIVNCVITKDASRFGRDHIVTGHYIERYFPEHNIRYISVDDNWDSKYDSIEILLYKMTFNDIYCKDISKKIISSLSAKRANGLYVGSFAPYGYKKDPENKNHLIVDEEVSYIVKEIFDQAAKGLGTSQLAKQLTAKQYKTPGQYSKRGKQDVVVAGLWTTGMIRRILSNQVYCGDTVQAKRKKVNYKSKKVVNNPKEDWSITLNTHEPLVSREVFDICSKVVEQNAIKYRRSPTNTHLLGKILYCKDCGRRIAIQWKYKDKKPFRRYGVCGRYKKYSKYGVCTPHFIIYEELEDQVLSYTKKKIREYLDYLDTPTLIQENYKSIREQLKSMESMVDKLNKDISKCESVITNLYEDKVQKKITQSIFEMISQNQEKEIESINIDKAHFLENIRELKSQLNMDGSRMANTKKILNDFLSSDVMNQDTIYQIIERIDVGENDELDVWFRVRELNNINNTSKDVVC